MASTRSRLSRRYSRRIPAIDRSMAPAESPAPLPSAGTRDLRESRVDAGVRPYETSYDIAMGYNGERSIILP